MMNTRLLPAILAITLLTLAGLSGCNSSVNLDPKDDARIKDDNIERTDDTSPDIMMSDVPADEAISDLGVELEADLEQDVMADSGVDLAADMILDLIDDKLEDTGLDLAEDLEVDMLPLDTMQEVDTSTPDESIEFWGIIYNGSKNLIVRFNWDNPDSVSVIKETSYILLTGLEFDGDGNLWALNCKNGYSGSELYLVNQQTGDFTLTGESDIALDDLAWNRVDSLMYGVNPWMSNITQYTRLNTINLTNGEILYLGDITDDGPAVLNYMSGIGADSSGYFYYYNNSSLGQDENEQGIFKSTEPGGLDTTFLHNFSEVLGEPISAFQIGPVFVDWSRDNLGYASVRYQPTGSTTHTYHVTFNDNAIQSSTLHTLQSFGILWSLTRKPDSSEF
jgi:hypothetical protein